MKLENGISRSEGKIVGNKGSFGKNVHSHFAKERGPSNHAILFLKIALVFYFLISPKDIAFLSRFSHKTVVYR